MVTLNNVAKRAKVSQATVHLVLHPKNIVNARGEIFEFNFI